MTLKKIKPVGRLVERDAAAGLAWFLEYVTPEANAEA